MDAVQAGNVEGMTRGDLMEEINQVEADIRRRLPIGWSTSYASLVREFVQQQGLVGFFLLLLLSCGRGRGGGVGEWNFG